MYSRQPPHAPEPRPVGPSHGAGTDSDRIDLGELFAKVWRRKALIVMCVLIGALTFGFAVGNVGFLGTLAIILIGHAVTIPTAMAIADRASQHIVTLAKQGEF